MAEKTPVLPTNNTIDSTLDESSPLAVARQNGLNRLREVLDGDKEKDVGDGNMVIKLTNWPIMRDIVSDDVKVSVVSPSLPTLATPTFSVAETKNLIANAPIECRVESERLAPRTPQWIQGQERWRNVENELIVTEPSRPSDPSFVTWTQKSLENDRGLGLDHQQHFWPGYAELCLKLMNAATTTTISPHP